MVIKFNPQHRNDTLTLAKQGDTLIVNGSPFDFSPLPDGATLPADAIGHPFFCGPVERINGELHVSIILPIGANPSHQATYPQPITVTANGVIGVPK
jgi:hypothetical protein